MTARELVNFTRTLVGVYERSKLADGFGDEALTADRAILPNYNEGLKRLIETGYSECYETLTLENEDAATTPYEYGLPTAIHGIVDVRLGSTNQKLKLTSISALNEDYPGWRTAARGTVTHYYLEGHFIGVYPKPTVLTETIIMLCQVIPTLPSTETDSPLRLPEAFQTVACHYAASVLCDSFATEAASEVQATMFMSKAARNLTQFEEGRQKLAEWVQSRHMSESDRRFRVSEPRIQRYWGR